VTMVVSPVVTSCSPEGHMIDDNYGDNDDEGGGGGEQVLNTSSQILLVCCWRTMKEVALLLGDLAQNAPIMRSHADMTSLGSNKPKKDQNISEGVIKNQTVTSVVVCSDATNTLPALLLPNDVRKGLLTSRQVCCIGEFFTTVLLTSKHHGAFELAYNGFVKLCSILWTCSDKDLRALPLKWLDALLADIAGCVPSDVLCGTRRSAGVPFFVQAIVTTEPILAGRASFKRLMNDLLTVASQPVNSQVVVRDFTLPQVHARNILRALYRDTRLGEEVFPCVPSGLKVAISGFLSDSWAVSLVLLTIDDDDNINFLLVLFQVIFILLYFRVGGGMYINL